MTKNYGIQHVKIFSEYFQAVIEGRKPFEIRKVDGIKLYNPGEKLLLRELESERYIGVCSLYENCPYVDEVKNECYDYGEEEARDICGYNRAACEDYRIIKYTGRWCLIEVKEVFKLTKMGLPEYVAFTFNILDKGSDEPSEVTAC